MCLLVSGRMMGWVCVIIRANVRCRQRAARGSGFPYGDGDEDEDDLVNVVVRMRATSNDARVCWEWGA